MDPLKFFEELKRRNVYKIAVAYAVVGWLLIQIATQVFPFFDISNWAVRLCVIAVLIGFPVALVIAWAFDLTPEGIKRSGEGSLPAQSRNESHAWIYVALVAGVLSTGLFFLGRYTAINRTGSAVAIPAKSIAVLPFENLSEDQANAYFADGMQDEIITRLANVADLKVIARSSTHRYKTRPEDLSKVADELGVAHFVEGSVQRSGDRVRINVQLIRSGANDHLWAQTYDRRLTDIFAWKAKSRLRSRTLCRRNSREESEKLSSESPPIVSTLMMPT